MRNCPLLCIMRVGYSIPSQWRQIFDAGTHSSIHAAASLRGSSPVKRIVPSLRRYSAGKSSMICSADSNSVNARGAS